MMPFAALVSVGSVVLFCNLALAVVPERAPGDDLDTLIESYRAKDASVRTRLETVTEIAALGTPEARGFLEEVCLGAKSTILKRTIFDTFRNELAPMPEGLRDEAVLDRDPYLRAHGLEILAEADPTAARGPLRDALTEDEDVRVRLTAIEALARNADGKTARFLFITCATLSPREQRLAVASLAAIPGEVFGPVLGGEEPWWADRDVKVRNRLLGALVLASRGEEVSRKPLTRLVKDRDDRVAFAAALGLDRMEAGGGGRAMKKAMKKARAVEDRCAVLRVVQESGLISPGLAELLIEELEHRDWTVRAAAAEALGSMEVEAAVEPLAQLLREADRWPVQIACVRALGACRQAAAVEVLIGLLDQLTGRLAHEASLSLFTSTGMDLGRRSASWQRWWADHRDGFEPAPLAFARWADVAGPGETYAFYGIPVHSDRLAFVLDVSGSMRGGKLERLKKELTTIIERLPEHSLFNMVFFAGSVNPWRDRLQRMTAKNRKAAIEEVRDRAADGGTNLWGGLLEAFEDEDVDTIYLLSDGEPTAGQFTNLATICSKISEENLHRRVAFHVVLIGMKSRDLQKLALDSGGTYVQHRP